MTTILGKIPEHDNLEKPKENISFVLRDREEDFPLVKSVLISTVAHPLVLLITWGLTRLLILLLALAGLSLPMFMKPEPKPKDIEFVIVNKPEQQPINKKTNLRSDRNSRAGGKHDPKKKIAEPEPVSHASKPQKASSQSRPAPRKIVKQTQNNNVERAERQPSPKVPPRPILHRNTSSPPVVTNPNPLSVPVPVTKMPKMGRTTGGPVTTGPIASSNTSNNSAAPILSPGSGESSSYRRSGSYSPGGGDPGNPGPGNPYGAPGIDAIREPDFGPYMRELQRRIKRNWNPPRGNESKRVVLMFKVNRDGQLLLLKVDKTSGVAEADKAALDAVRLTAPFRPLPPEFRGKDIDIQFTFDYNVFGLSGAQRI